MVVVKRQRRGKPLKIEQRKPRGPQLKQTALQASSIYIQQGQGRREKNIKRGAKIEPGASLRIFWVDLASHLEDVFSFAF